MTRSTLTANAPGSAAIRHAVEGRSLFGAEEDGSGRMHGYTVGRFVRAPDGRRNVELWTRPGWADGHAWRFGTAAQSGRWRLSIDLGPSPRSSPASDSPPPPWTPPDPRPGRLVRETADFLPSFADLPTKRWILLSAGIPVVDHDPARREREKEHVSSARPDEIVRFVEKLVDTAAKAGIGIVSGGHPSIIRMLAPVVVRRAREPGVTPWLALFQWDGFRHQRSEELGVILAAKGVIGLTVPSDVRLPQMRAAMLGVPGLIAAVFAGGLSGTVEEFELAGKLRADLPRIAVGVGGGAAASLLLGEHADAATGALPGAPGVSVPGKLWYSAETAVKAILDRLGV